MKVVVTGAGGYIGSRLIAKAVDRGWSVVAASRTPIRGANIEWMHYTLEDAVDPRSFPRNAVMVHLAADTRSSEIDAEVELRALSQLIVVSRVQASKVLLLSSQAAAPDAPTAYGRAKWQAEKEVLGAGGTIVRAGLVYGGERRGLFGTLVDLVARHRVLPVFAPAPPVQPIHVDDLAEGLCRIIERSDCDVRKWALGARRPESFTGFLRAIARHRVRRTRILVPVPAMAVAIADRLVPMRWRNRIDVGRVRSLMATRPMDTSASLDRLGLALRPLHEGMHASGTLRRRRLAIEGRTLVTYALSDKAPYGCVRRYIRAVEGLRDGELLSLSSAVHRFPSLVALLERPRDASPELMWRIDAATLIAEACPEGARRFVALRSSNRVVAAVRIGWVVAGEIAVRLVRPFLAPLLHRRATSSGDA